MSVCGVPRTPPNEQSKAKLLLGQLCNRKLVGLFLQICATAERNICIPAPVDLVHTDEGNGRGD